MLPKEPHRWLAIWAMVLVVITIHSVAVEVNPKPRRLFRRGTQESNEEGAKAVRNAISDGVRSSVSYRQFISIHGPRKAKSEPLWQKQQQARSGTKAGPTNTKSVAFRS